MAENGLPLRRQPDALPEHPVPSPPSLWLYGALVLFATVLVIAAFRESTDWPGFLLNFATEILGAVLLLLIVEQRLRASELRQIQQLPGRALTGFLILRSPLYRQLHRYGRVLLASLSRVLDISVQRVEVENLLPKLDEGFLLLGSPGVGKTTWLQMAAAKRAREFLSSPTNHKVPVLLPLRLWLPDMTPEEAILKHLNSYSHVSRRTFRRAMERGQLFGILDGVDEMIPDMTSRFLVEFDRLRSKYPLIPWTVSSRPCSVQIPGLEVVEMPPPTEEEILEIRRRIRS